MKKAKSSASKLRRAVSVSVSAPTSVSIIIDEEFSRLIPPLTSEEKNQLEANLKAYGCLDPLVLWAGTNILLDGHHRYPICQQHGIEFQTVSIALPDREAAADWIDANQLGRRNLKPDQFSLLLGRRYNRSKKEHGGDRKSSGQNVHMNPQTAKTARSLAKRHGVDERTVRRAGKFAEAVEKMKAVDPEIERKVSEGKAPPKRAVVKAAELVEQDPDQAKAVLEGTVTVAQMEGVAQSDAADNIVNKTGAADTAEAIALRATEANEAVLALGDALASVSVDARKRLRRVLGDLSTLWRRLFEAKVASTTAVALTQDSNQNSA